MEKKGWLQGKSKYIVFDIVELTSFCFFETQKLYKWAKQIERKAKNKSEFNALYTRKNRKDVLIKVKYETIKNLETYKINYNE